MSDFDMPDWDWDDDEEGEDLACAYCEGDADFYCYQCSKPICIQHTVPVALRTNYCTACMGRALAKAEAAND